MLPCTFSTIPPGTNYSTSIGLDTRLLVPLIDDGGCASPSCRDGSHRW